MTFRSLIFYFRYSKSSTGLPHLGHLSCLSLHLEFLNWLFYPFKQSFWCLRFLLLDLVLENLKPFDFLLTSFKVWLKKLIVVLCDWFCFALNKLTYLSEKRLSEMLQQILLCLRPETHNHFLSLIQSHFIFLVFRK
jgi:hypothetical protein